MKSVNTLLREIEQIERSNISPEMKAKFLQQKNAELEMMARTLPDAPHTPAPPPAAAKTK